MWAGTDILLDSGDSFVSQTRMTNRDDFVNGIAASDVAGTITVEQTSDPRAADPRTSADADWYSTDDDSFDVDTDAPAMFSVKLKAPYWRLNYLNSSSDQAEFRLDARTMSAGDS